MKIKLAASFYMSMLLLCLTTPACSTELNSSLDHARKNCGYDLGGVESHIINEDSRLIGKDGLQQSYSLGWSQGSKKFRATLTLNCVVNSPLPLYGSEPVLSPKELITEEDSGGRYARHVAWQKPLVAINWTGKVAYIDYVLGDGQRSYVNDFIMCDSDVPAPCISLSVNDPVILDPKDISSVLSILSKVSSVR